MQLNIYKYSIIYLFSIKSLYVELPTSTIDEKVAIFITCKYIYISAIIILAVDF